MPWHYYCISSHTYATDLQAMQQYLKDEIKAKHCGAMGYQEEAWCTLAVKCPQQANYYDCGITKQTLCFICSGL